MGLERIREKRNAYKVLVGKFEGKITPEGTGVSLRIILK
jgi:hypothetical protein